jgi:hypothetical protein
MSKNFDAYIALDKTGLENKYVIIVNGDVVAKGEHIEELLDSVRQEYPHERWQRCLRKGCWYYDTSTIQRRKKQFRDCSSPGSGDNFGKG